MLRASRILIDSGETRISTEDRIATIYTTVSGMFLEELDLLEVYLFRQKVTTNLPL